MKRHAREREIRLWSNMRQGDGDTASDHNSEAAARLPRVWAARAPLLTASSSLAVEHVG